MKAGSWPMILLVYAFGVAGAATTSKIIPLHGLFDALSGGPGLFAAMLALVGLPAALLGGVSGTLTDRIGARTTLLLGGGIGIAANLLALTAASDGAYIAIRLIEGLALIAIFSAAPAALMVISDGKRRVAAMALWSTYSPVGVSLGLGLGALSVTQQSIHLAFTVHAGLFAAITAAGLMLPRGVRPAPSGSMSLGVRIAAIAEAYRQSSVSNIAGAFFLIISSAFGVSIVLAGHLGKVHGLPASQSSAMLGMANLMMIPGAFLAGARLNQGVAAPRLFGGVALVGTVGGTLIFLPETPVPMLLPILCVWCLCLGAATATALATLPRVADRTRLGAAAGLMSQAGAAATLLAPPVWLAALESERWLALVILIAMGWSGACFLLARALRRAPDARDATSGAGARQ